MKLLDYMDTDCIKAPLESGDKHGVIEELVGLLAGAGRVREPGVLSEAVWAREQIRTTGIGHGLAIPHGKCDVLDEIAIAIGKPKEPIDFDAMDGEPVKLVVLLASPLDRTSDHIHALSRIGRLMTHDAFREAIYEADTPERIHELLLEHEEDA